MKSIAAWGTLLEFAVLAASFSSALADGPAGATSTCNRLAGELGTAVVVTSGDDYNNASADTWSLFNAEARPSCVVLPRNANHVQVAMQAIYEDKVRYAVQAGSHSAMRGWNNVNRGVLISFDYMKEVSYNSAKNTVTLQPGIHWGEAITALEPYGITIMGGRLGDVGTGLLLGGGLSYLSPAHGFSSDAYVELDVVLVDGTLVTATATNQYSDLFRALKGGANRFGIVTRYEVTAIETGFSGSKNWYGGLIAFADDAAPALLEATAKYVREVNDPNAALLVVLGYQVLNGELFPAHAITPIYRGPSLPTDVFGDFLSIPSVFQQVGPLDYSEVASILGAGADRGTGQLFGASAFTGDNVTRYHSAFTHWQNFTQTFKDELSGVVLAFTPVADSQILAGRARGGNVIDPPLGGYAAVQFHTQHLPGVTVVSPELELGRKLYLSQIPRSPGLPLYINECDASQDVFSTYGQYEFLKQTYKKYDPTRFNVRFTDGPRGL
uniref:FAD-binding protein n=1 Tax=Volvariella volvacea TaxID=36659 RepID=M9Z2W4_9AGAR|nr:FAD-binding protein [Volvariella volvacea]